MDKEKDYFDQIKRYLEDHMSVEEKDAFEAKVDRNTDLQDELSWWKSVLEAEDSANWVGSEPVNLSSKQMELLRKFDEQVMKEEELSSSEDRKDGTTETELQITWQWMAAASLTLLLTVAIFLINFESKEERLDQKIMAYSSQHHTSGLTSRNIGEKESWIEAYEARNYREVLEFLRRQKPDTPDKPTSQEDDQFFGAMCFFYLGQYKDAIGSFESELLQNSIYREEADWFLALSYLNDQEVKRGKSVLQRIVNSKQFKTTEARELLELL